MKSLESIAQFFALKSAILQPGLVVKGLSLDSRQIQPGWVFVALAGENQHGADYWQQAKSLGAVGIVSDRSIGESDLPVFVIKDLNTRLADFAAWFYDHPSQKLQLIGITGTNGKTSTTQYIAQLLEAQGLACGVLGTLGNGRLNQLEPSANTTMDVVALNGWLHCFVQQGYPYAVLEVSSHAIALGRIAGLRFACVGLTQVSRDHLDFHRDLLDYQATKKRLFSDFPSQHKVVNLDDSIGLEIAESQPGRVVTYSQQNPLADLYLSDVTLSANGMAGCLQYRYQEYGFNTGLIGRFNLENSLCALSCLLAVGLSVKKMTENLALLRAIVGRMEKVVCHNSARNVALNVLVDFAHTPDALEQVLLSIRAHLTTEKLWLVFGCGGNRDAGKRPLMAQVAERLADKIILTNDNPRFEDPKVIIEDICQGLSEDSRAKVHIEYDRQAAIEYALDNAQAGDWVLLAGKGHENYQDIGGVKTPFSDQQVITAWQQ
ncbi:UDP-N-acetylmuramoyl-L-alanyl-D-glutamate--2,6-diaminopimelate ligase [Thiomicrospira microaerophila]|uniref:UDP-N-acetylmuramoyl-L-alanyl-D-glutamate--2, 6-diaminopimelate ligase n=1 Tax=Thiomicrospira microaerophila TaxID=406020 RepID=UPI0005C9BA91|nr:UDP-N-acetylmuramoyl-L-alanyl-D-glutamate--2,6-diaminopimelate ligase [Thiomicrospira microaerophila]